MKPFAKSIVAVCMLFALFATALAYPLTYDDNSKELWVSAGTMAVRFTASEPLAIGNVAFNSIGGTSYEVRLLDSGRNEMKSMSLMSTDGWNVVDVSYQIPAYTDFYVEVRDDANPNEGAPNMGIDTSQPQYGRSYMGGYGPQSPDNYVHEWQMYDGNAMIRVNYEAEAENMPPVAVLVVPSVCKVGEVCRLDSSESYDPDGYLIMEILEFGDESTTSNKGPDTTSGVWSAISGRVVEHIYNSPGTYNAKLAVTDNDWEHSYDHATVVVWGGTQEEVQVYVKTVNAHTGEIVAGANVVVYKDGQMWEAAYTDNYGKTHFELVPGSYKMTASAENYESYIAYANVEISETFTFQLIPEGGAGQEVRLGDKFKLGYQETAYVVDFKNMKIRYMGTAVPTCGGGGATYPVSTTDPTTGVTSTATSDVTCVGGEPMIELDVRIQTSTGETMGTILHLGAGQSAYAFGANIRMVDILGWEHPNLEAYIMVTEGQGGWCGDGICADTESPYSCPGDCGDPNICVCPEYWMPVCGVNGKTYGNPCEAECDNVPIAYEGVCREDDDATEVAMCLSERATYYWTNNCAHCIMQNKEFGNAFNYLNEVDCLEDMNRCREEGITAYPTWDILGQRYLGYKSLGELSRLARCKESVQTYCEGFQAYTSDDAYSGNDVIRAKFFCEQGMLDKMVVYLNSPTGEELVHVSYDSEFGLVEVPVAEYPRLFTQAGRYNLRFQGVSSGQEIAYSTTFTYSPTGDEHEETIVPVMLGEPFKLQIDDTAVVRNYPGLMMRLLDVQEVKCGTGEKCVGGSYATVAIMRDGMAQPVPITGGGGVSQPIAVREEAVVQERLVEPVRGVLTRAAAGVLQEATGLITNELVAQKISPEDMARAASGAGKVTIQSTAQAVEAKTTQGGVGGSGTTVAAMPIYRIYNRESIYVHGVRITSLGMAGDTAGFVIEQDEIEPPEWPDGETFVLRMNEGWNLFAMPGAVYADEQNMQCKPDTWRIFEYVKETNSFQEATSPQPDKAYWVYVPTGGTCKVELTLTHSMPLEKIPALTPGWNFVPIVPEMVGVTISDLGQCDLKSAYMYDAWQHQWRRMLDREITKDMYGQGMVIKSLSTCKLVRMGDILVPPPLPEEPELPPEEGVIIGG